MRAYVGVSGRIPAGQARTVTFQRGSTGFHVVMTVVSAGLWLPVWLACRRTVRVNVRETLPPPWRCPNCGLQHRIATC